MHIIQYNRWRQTPMEDPDLAAELAAIEGDGEAIRERFGAELVFGTAGMRGVLGAGTGRMNIYTVRRASQGLAALLAKNGGAQSVAIGYDSRRKSDVFARAAAGVLAQSGIQVYLYQTLVPVPMVSFAVRQLGCGAGIMITASHNPAQYNGFKVYGPDGCQMNTQDAAAVMAEMERTDIFDDVHSMAFEAAVAAGRVRYIGEEVQRPYYQNVLAQAVRGGLLSQDVLRVVYSPLNGAGNVPVRQVLATCGVRQLWVPPAQEAPDPDFSTCPYPNPENAEALQLAIELAGQVDADLVLATDPDADRVGIAVKAEGQYRLLSGNEVGVLLMDYILRGRSEAQRLPKDAVCVKSIVTTPMADAVAAAYGAVCESCLTGFKYIGERIAQLEAAGQVQRFVFGFEESYGYLAGSYVRDKDAVVASMLICEMAAFYKQAGQSLWDAMEALYAKHGRYLAEVENFTFEGLVGQEKMEDIMSQLRKTPPKTIGGQAVAAMADYEAQAVYDPAGEVCGETGLPRSNVLSYTLAGGSVVTVRPSGTEPKVKVYYAVKEKTLAEAQALYRALSADMRPVLN